MLWGQNSIYYWENSHLFLQYTVASYRFALSSLLPVPLPTYPQPWVRKDYISQTPLPLDPRLLGQ